MFEPRGSQELLDYLNGPADVGAQSGVRLHALYEDNETSRPTSPCLRGVDAVHLVAWANTDGGKDSAAVAARQRGPAGERRPDRPAGRSPAWPATSAPCWDRRGGACLVDALEAQNVAVAPVGLLAGGYDERVERGRLGAVIRHLWINLICVNADALPLFVDGWGPTSSRDSTRSGSGGGR